MDKAEELVGRAALIAGPEPTARTPPRSLSTAFDVRPVTTTDGATKSSTRSSRSSEMTEVSERRGRATSADATHARRGVFESGLVCALSEWLIMRDFLFLSQTSSGCSREVGANLHTLNLGEDNGFYTSFLTDKDVAYVVRRFPRLCSLTLTGNSHVTDAALVEIARLPKLRELDISGCDITVNGMATLPEGLESIALGDYQKLTKGGRLLSDEGVTAAARRCPRLRTLNLECTGAVTDAAIIEVANLCPHLQTLNLDYAKLVTDRAVIHAAEHCDLKSVDLSNKDNITDESILALAKNCPNLEVLRCDSFDKDDARITDAAVLALARCTRLETLDLAGFGAVTDASIVPLVTRCRSLLDLCLNFCSVSDVGVMSIARNCPMITALSLGGESRVHESIIHDKSIVALASGCPRLRFLSIDSEVVTDESCMALARGCVDLRSLYITCPITDTGLIAIAQRCLFLHSLTLDTRGITDAGIAACSCLESFNMRNNDSVTVQAIIALIRRSPDLDDLWVDGHFREIGRQIYAAGEYDAIIQSHPKLYHCLELPAHVREEIDRRIQGEKDAPDIVDL